MPRSIEQVQLNSSCGLLDTTVMLNALRKRINVLFEQAEVISDGAQARLAFVSASGRSGRKSESSSRFMYIYDADGELFGYTEQHKAATPSGCTIYRDSESEEPWIVFERQFMLPLRFVYDIRDAETGLRSGRLKRLGYRIEGPQGQPFAHFVDPLPWRARLIRDFLHGVVDRLEIHIGDRRIATLAKEPVKYRDVTKEGKFRADNASWVLAIYEGDSEELRRVLVPACYIAIVNKLIYQGIE